MKEKKKRNQSRFVLTAVFFAVFDLLLQFYFKKVGFGIGNRGMSFGIGSDIVWPIELVLTILVLFFGCWMFYSRKNLNPYLLVIFAGGTSNLIARLTWGEVWDYIEVPFLGLWINLSDTLITLGSFSYILVTNDKGLKGNG